jgi:hypothetical protein
MPREYPRYYHREPGTAEYTTTPPEVLTRAQVDKYLENGELVKLGSGYYYVRGGGIYTLTKWGSGHKALLDHTVSRHVNFYLINGWCTLSDVPEITQAYSYLYMGGRPVGRPLYRLTCDFRRQYGFEWYGAPRVRGSEPWLKDLQEIRTTIDARWLGPRA